VAIMRQVRAVDGLKKHFHSHTCHNLCPPLIEQRRIIGQRRDRIDELHGFLAEGTGGLQGECDELEAIDAGEFIILGVLGRLAERGHGSRLGVRLMLVEICCNTNQ
jgi:hypothetical protein